MTLTQAIHQADLARPNELEPELKLAWLSALDGQIHRELLSAHLGPVPDLPVYGPETDPETELLVPGPWDELYVRYLLMRIDLENGELERYNNDAACFNRSWRAWAGDYVRTHTPLGVNALRF